MTIALGPEAEAAGYRLVVYDRVGSTSTEAYDAANAGDPGKIWFVSLEQTAGRGRRGRDWQTPPGNLAASLLLRPDCDMGQAATLGFAAGVALNAAISKLLPDLQLKTGIDGADTFGERKGRVALKWPNDVLIDGAKLSGILLESRPGKHNDPSVTIGIGVNIVSAPEGLPYPTICTSQFAPLLTAGDIFSALSDAWVEAYALWDNGRGLPALLARWRQSAAGLGAPVVVQTHNGVVRGIFETIDDDGRLIVLDSAGKRMTVTAGDVHFGITATSGEETNG